jgi:hypothetical protein
MTDVEETDVVSPELVDRLATEIASFGNPTTTFEGLKDDLAFAKSTASNHYKYRFKMGGNIIYSTNAAAVIYAVYRGEGVHACMGHEQVSMGRMSTPSSSFRMPHVT